MNSLDKDIAAFEKMREELEKSELGRWVVIHDENLIGVFDTFNDAAQEATRRFGRGPYLIREIGATALALPASVLYQPIDA